jgi:TetR/AcrR family tetracycline transcriptional repressor
VALTRDQVVETAIRLLDENGLDALTLRRLAAELGVSAPTLYWHVRDKRELLDLMVVEMATRHRVRQPPPSADLDFADSVAEAFRRQYHAIVAHRDGARVFAGNRPTEASMPYIERYLSRWVGEGFPPGEALTTILALGDFVIGAALEYQAEVERQREQPADRLKEVWEKMKSFPNLHAAAIAGAGRGQGNRGFEHGLSLFVAGLRQRQAELARERAPAPGTAGPARRAGAAATRRPAVRR